MLTSPRFELMAPVAQWIEHLPSKQRAAGSSPAGGTTFLLSSGLTCGHPLSGSHRSLAWLDDLFQRSGDRNSGLH